MNMFDPMEEFLPVAPVPMPEVGDHNTTEHKTTDYKTTDYGPQTPDQKTADHGAALPVNVGWTIELTTLQGCCPMKLFGQMFEQRIRAMAAGADGFGN